MSHSYLEIENHVKELAIKCGRNPSDIMLLAASKTQSIERIWEVYEAGCKYFGESRIQEALSKRDALPADIIWHFIGTLQSNKVNKVIGLFDLIESVDSPELAKKISEASQKKGIITSVLLEVNTSGEKSKHGLDRAGWIEHFVEVSQLSHILIEGLMTIGPHVEDENLVRKSFIQLRELKDELQNKVRQPELFRHLSMGMTHDYSIAVEEGATILRIGSGIFGERI